MSGCVLLLLAPPHLLGPFQWNRDCILFVYYVFGISSAVCPPEYRGTWWALGGKGVTPIRRAGNSKKNCF